MKIYDRVEPYIWLLILCAFIYFILFVVGTINTKKKGFSYILPIYIGLVFIPFSIVLYNLSTILYSLLYIVVCYVASLITYKYKR